MWLLNVVPESFIYLLTIIGILGVVLASIPIPLPAPLVKNRKIFLITCLMFMSLGLFLQGANAERKVWAVKVAQMETQIAKLQQEAGKITVQVVTEYVDRVREVQVRGETIIREVPVYITQESDEKCIIPEGFVDIHDRAALNLLLNAERK